MSSGPHGPIFFCTGITQREEYKNCKLRGSAMDGAEAEQQQPPELRSLHSNANSFVSFVSRTRRMVDVFWIDFKGKHVKYATLCNYGDTFPIFTFVSHPWTFKDADSGDQLVHSGNKEVYFPKAVQGEDLQIVLIGIKGKNL